MSTATITTPRVVASYATNTVTDQGYTYNQAGLTYNEVGVYYGGVDQKSSPAPRNLTAKVR